MQTLKRALLLVSTCLLILVCGCEREGIVDITDCPEKLYLDHGTKQGSRPLSTWTEISQQNLNHFR